MKPSILALRSLVETKLPRRITLRTRIENQLSIWLSQDACLGVKWKTMRCSGSRRNAPRLATGFRDAALALHPEILFQATVVGHPSDHAF